MKTRQSSAMSLRVMRKNNEFDVLFPSSVTLTFKILEIDPQISNCWLLFAFKQLCSNLFGLVQMKSNLVVSKLPVVEFLKLLA